MKKALAITLNGIVFNIEEDAYERLNDYLNSIKKHFGKSTEQDADEIVEDIEASIAEKFSTKPSMFKKVITLKEVNELIKVMGTVSDMDADGTVDSEEVESENQKTGPNKEVRKLYRNPDDVAIAGVCSGLAAYFGLDVVWVRLAFIISVFIGGSGIFIYLALWIAMPIAETSAQKLEMQGEPINLANLKENLKKKVVKNNIIGNEVDEDNVETLKKRDQRAADIVGLSSFGIMLKIFFRVISVIVGVSLLIASIIVHVVIIFLSIALIMKVHLPALEELHLLQGVFTGWVYYLIIVSVALVVLIPFTFLSRFASFLISYKATMGFRELVFLVSLWMMAILTLILAVLTLSESTIRVLQLL